MIDAHRIVYNNLGSEEFDVTLHLSFGGDSGTVSSFLNREGVYTEHYDGHRTIHRIKNNEVLTPRFTLIKKDFGDFDSTENRRILSWLTASEKPGWFEVYKDDSNAMEWRIFGYVTSVEQYKLGNGRIVGYEFEVESSHPHAWSHNFIYPEVHETIAEISENKLDNDWLKVNGEIYKDDSNVIKPLTIDCETDEYGKLLYPKVTIRFDGDEYIPVRQNPISDEYSMLPNVIYTNNNRYYIRIPTENYKGELGDNPFLSDPTPEKTVVDAGYIGKYFYFKNHKSIYRAIRVCEVAKGYVKDVVYYADDKGLNKTDPQPTNDTELQAKTYYVQKRAEDNTLMYAWEFITKVGTGCRITNTSVTNYLGENVIAELVGCTLGEELVLDGTNKVISSSLTNSSTFGRTFGDDFNWVWPPLAYGENNFIVVGNCSIRFEWIEPRKVGSL